MARTTAENEAISRKIQVLMMEGYPKHQATAIAIDMFKRGKLRIIPVSPQRTRTRTLAQQLRRAVSLLGLAKLGYDAFKKPSK